MSVDFSGGELRVNLSKDEAEVRDFEPLPIGKFPCFITDGEVRFSTSEKNNGKPYYAFEFTVSDGKYENRKLWCNAMLFEGALYTITGMLKAIDGRSFEAGDTTIPALDWFIGKPIGVRTKMGKAQVGTGTPESPQYPARVEVGSFYSLANSEAPSSASLLP
jgi:hypothetical protein